MILFTVDFDKLGLTDNENPLGVLPPVFGRSMGQAAGSMLAHYVGEYLHTRRKREAVDQPSDTSDTPPLPESQQHVFHGGERAILYGVVEDLIKTFGFNGKACILRTICEVHSKSIHHLGLFGEMAKLFFTYVSKIILLHEFQLILITNAMQRFKIKVFGASS